MTTVVGVDPGGRWTGIVARTSRDDVAEAVLVTRQDGESIDDWCRSVTRAVIDAVLRCDALAVAVEGTRPPNPHMGLTNVRALLDTAWVAGAVVGAMAGTETAVDIVDPGGHGSLPLWVYPPVLVGAREGEAGTGKRRHVRSAWDIAGASRWRT